MTRAFMVQPGRDDVSRARRFGEVTYLFGASDRRPPIWSDEFQAELAERLRARGYDPDVDYVVMTGHLATVALFVSAVHAAWPGSRPQALFYDKAQEDYVQRRLGAACAPEGRAA
jgi:hypothetical protein